MTGIYLLIACIVSSACASLFLKLASTRSLAGSLDLLRILNNPMLWLGGFCYAAAFLGYVYLLRFFPLSLAQPAITAGVSVVTTLMAVFFLREQINTVNWAGVLLVCVGVYFLFWQRG
jgi:drug/metabolite transporter (DMT)-like permease